MNHNGNGMLPVSDVTDRLAGLGFERIVNIPGSTFRDTSTVIVIPTRGTINYRVVAAWQSLIAPMNQKRAILFCAGDEVGQAYNRMITNILADPVLSTWKYLLTLEDDNLVPADAHVRLLESIESGPFDAVGGLYWTKGDVNMPMCYGDPEEYRRTGVLDFRPRNVAEAIKHGNVVECNGLAMGCTLYRMDLFRQIPAPWFVTVADVIPDKGPQCFTQDLNFCDKAKRLGKRMACDCRVHVGHLAIDTGIVY